MLACPYEELDPYGFLIGIVAFIIAMAFSFLLLRRHDLNTRPVLNIFMLSAIGHFVGAWGLFEFSVHMGADSCFYFQNATLEFQGVGYKFAFFILGYAKHYLLNESFLGAFLISGAIALIGTTYLVATYKVLLDKISQNNKYFLYDAKQIIYPALLLFCWPSYFFWSAGIIKDNFAFIAIMMTLYTLACGRIKPSSIPRLTIACLLGFMVRPYLFVIFSISSFIYVLMGSNLKLSYKIVIYIGLGTAFSLLTPVLSAHGSMVNINGLATLKTIGEYAIKQQGYMAIGSSISVPTQDPHLMFLFIPWLIFANLLLPLIFGSSNLIGIAASFENAYLLWWIIWFFKNWPVWQYLSGQLRILKFFIVYFLFGMTCLSIMCTNLGLAMREKMMYVPALLICMFLTFAYKRMLIIEQCNQTEDAPSTPPQNNLLKGYS